MQIAVLASPRWPWAGGGGGGEFLGQESLGRGGATCCHFLVVSTLGFAGVLTDF